jgi:hypothetical protein
MFDKIKVEEWKNVAPLFIYRRINMVTFKNPFYFALTPGYWYVLRSIRAKWPEIDAAGAVFAPEINIDINESARAKVHQNVPVPLRLLTSPASNGVQINAGLQMTATGPRNVKILDEVRLFQDNVTFQISGQNATPFPAFVDILVIGYLFPGGNSPMWKGTTNE